MKFGATIDNRKVDSNSSYLQNTFTTTSPPLQTRISEKRMLPSIINKRKMQTTTITNMRASPAYKLKKARCLRIINGDNTDLSHCLESLPSDHLNSNLNCSILNNPYN